MSFVLQAPKYLGLVLWNNVTTKAPIENVLEVAEFEDFPGTDMGYNS